MALNKISKHIGTGLSFVLISLRYTSTVFARLVDHVSYENQAFQRREFAFAEATNRGVNNSQNSEKDTRVRVSLS